MCARVSATFKINNEWNEEEKKWARVNSIQVRRRDGQKIMHLAAYSELIFSFAKVPLYGYVWGLQ